MATPVDVLGDGRKAEDVTEISCFQQGVRSLLDGIRDLHLFINLKSLNLHQNDVEVIEGLSNLRQLTELNLSSNRISVVHEGAFSHLTRLQYLNLSGNKIVRVDGQALAPLISLEVLILSFNKITRTDFLIELRGSPELPHPLRKLDMKGNRINALSDLHALGHLGSLEELCLQEHGRGNPVCALPLYADTLQQLIPRVHKLDGRVVGAGAMPPQDATQHRGIREERRPPSVHVPEEEPVRVHTPRIDRVLAGARDRYANRGRLGDYGPSGEEKRNQGRAGGDRFEGDVPRHDGTGLSDRSRAVEEFARRLDALERKVVEVSPPRPSRPGNKNPKGNQTSTREYEEFWRRYEDWRNKKRSGGIPPAVGTAQPSGQYRPSAPPTEVNGNVWDGKMRMYAEVPGNAPGKSLYWKKEGGDSEAKKLQTVSMFASEIESLKKEIVAERERSDQKDMERERMLTRLLHKVEGEQRQISRLMEIMAEKEVEKSARTASTGAYFHPAQHPHYQQQQLQPIPLPASHPPHLEQPLPAPPVQAPVPQTPVSTPAPRSPFRGEQRGNEDRSDPNSEVIKILKEQLEYERKKVKDVEERANHGSIKRRQQELEEEGDRLRDSYFSRERVLKDLQREVERERELVLKKKEQLELEKERTQLLKDQIVALKDDIVSRDREIDSLDQKLESEQRACEDLHNNNQRLRLEVDDVNALLEKSHRQEAALQNAMEKALDDMKQMRHEAEEHRKRSEEKVEATERKLGKTREELEYHKNVEKEYLSELKYIENKHKREKEDLEYELEKKLKDLERNLRDRVAQDAISHEQERGLQVQEAVKKQEEAERNMKNLESEFRLALENDASKLREVKRAFEKATATAADLEEMLKASIQKETRAVAVANELKDIVKEQKERLVDLSKEKHDLGKELRLKEHEVIQLSDSEAELAQRIAELERAHAQMQADGHAKQTIIDDLRHDRKVAESQFKEREKALIPEKEKLNEKVTQLEGEKADAQRQLKECVESIRVKDKILEDQNDTITKLKAAIVTKEKELEDYKNNQCGRERELEEQLETETELSKNLHWQLVAQHEVREQTDQMVKELKEKYEATKAEAEEYRSRAQEKDEMIKFVEKEILDVKDLFTSREEQMRQDFETEIEEKRGEIVTLTKELDRLNEMAAACKSSADAASHDLEKKKEEVAAAKKQVAVVENEMRILLAEMDRQKKEMEKKKKQIATLFLNDGDSVRESAVSSGGLITPRSEVSM